MDDTDRRIVNELQRGFPIRERPFAAAADQLGLSESDLIARIEALLGDGTLTRFGPMFNAERMGGQATLCAMHVPAAALQATVQAINGFDEVAHNYERDHHLNIWFVIAAERTDSIASVIAAIERKTGYRVLDFPKSAEYFVGLYLDA